jgi:hypothetical protein
MVTVVSRMRASRRSVRSRDLRTAVRYPLAVPLKVSLKSQHWHPPVTGTGTCVEMSSRDVRFLSTMELPTGADVELAICWPSRLEDGVALQLIVQGKVTWSDSRQSAVEIRRMSFGRGELPR